MMIDFHDEIDILEWLRLKICSTKSKRMKIRRLLSPVENKREKFTDGSLTE